MSVVMEHDGFFALHWLPSENRWEPIAWDAWSAFRASDVARSPTPFAPLPGVRNGIHYFITGVHDRGETINIIPHKYLIERDGRIARDNFAGFTREDREDYARIMLAEQYGPGDRERLEELRDKMDVDDPPPESYNALVRALPGLPKLGSPAEERLAKFRRRG